MGRRVLACAAAASLLALTGCAAVVHPEGLTHDQLDAYAVANQDHYWDVAGLDDSLRPEGSPLRFVRFEQVGAYYAECMNERGLTGVPFLSVDLALHTAQARGASTELLLADYECQSSYQASPKSTGYYSTAELAATYDYYRDWLIPCLAVHGFDVKYAPERSVLALGPGALTWSPYEDIHLDDASIAQLTSECPPHPGFIDD